MLKNNSQETPLTADQVEAKISDVQARIALLEALSEKSTIVIDEEHLDMVNRELNKRHETLSQVTQELEDTRRRCWLAFDSSCEFWSKEENVMDALSHSAAANFKVEELKSKFGNSSIVKDQIELVLSKLRNQTEELQEQLVDSVHTSVSPLVSDIGTTEELSVEEVHDQWKYFEFSSSKAAAVTSLSSNASIGSIFPFSPKPA